MGNGGSARVKTSAGILPYRFREGRLEVMLVHPGGPLWKNKDKGAWSIAKGEADGSEELLEAAQRELTEETGFVALGPFVALGKVQQKSGKWVHAWACAASFETDRLVSNEFEMEWPPRSGRRQRFPEVDRAEYFPMVVAVEKVNPAQIPLLEKLEERVGGTE